MQRSKGSRLFPLFVIIIILALAVAAVVSIGRAVFNRAEPTQTEEVVDAGRDSLLNTSLSRSVSMTVRGPIVADEVFKSYKIVISPGKRQMDVYTGYLDERTGGKTFSNNTPSYEQFIHALDKANMMKGEVPKDDDANDLRGICATGYVHEFAVLNDDQSIKRLWTSTCKGSQGSLDASKDQLSNLFLVQIPDSQKLIPFKEALKLSF